MYMLAPMGVLAPVSAHAGPSAQPPIGTSINFPARVSAESPSIISPNPSEVISEVSELYDKLSWIYWILADFPVKIGLIGGEGGVPLFFFTVIFLFMSKFYDKSF